jgi:hypothetical protein
LLKSLILGERHSFFKLRVLIAYWVAGSFGPGHGRRDDDEGLLNLGLGVTVFQSSEDLRGFFKIARKLRDVQDNDV